VPMPYAKTLEKAFVPQPEKIVDAVHKVLYR
jgi:pyruvate/2-oxoglutarate/acetoin dehydrogenase E1 component